MEMLSDERFWIIRMDGKQRIFEEETNGFNLF